MGAALWLSGNGQGTNILIGGNTYQTLSSNNWGQSTNPFEDRAQLLIRDPGTLSNFGMQVYQNSMTVATATARIRINSANGNSVFTIPAGATGYFSDITNTDHVAAGDLLNTIVTVAFEFNNIVTSGLSAIFTADNAADTISRACSLYSFNNVTTGSARYTSLWGQISPRVSIDGSQDCIYTSLTARNAAVKARSNTSDANFFVTFQKNGIDTSIVVTIPAGTSGWFEDIVNKEALVNNDLVNWVTESPAYTSGTATLNAYAIDLVSITNQWTGGCGQIGRTVGENQTNYILPGGSNWPAVTEAEVKTEVPLNGQAISLCIYVSTNNIDNPSTLSWRTNGITGNNIVTIPANSTGFFDSTATDTFVIGDLINLELITGTDPAAGILIYSNIDWIGAISVLTTGTIIVNKITIPSTDTQSFAFTAGGGLAPGSFNLVNGGQQIFSGITPGSGYSIIETPNTLYLTEYDVSDGSPNTNIDVAENETVVVTVTNTRLSSQYSGIYRIVPAKRQDTLWVSPEERTTVDVKIPDPYVRLPLIGE